MKQRTCQWMCKENRWEDCGRPAVVIHKGSQLAYCEEHATALCMADGIEPPAPIINLPDQRVDQGTN